MPARITTAAVPTAPRPFLLLVAGVVVALQGKTIDKSLGGGLSGLGSVLSSFLAATFFKSAKRADRQLNLYYLEPQRTGRLLAAERLITQVTPSVAASGGKQTGSSGAAGAAGPVEQSRPSSASDSADDGGNPAVALLEQLVTAVLTWEVPARQKNDKSGAPKPGAAADQPSQP